MIITIIATGSRGDVQPYIALARGLNNAGHTTRFVAPANFAPLAERYGLEVWPIPGDTEAIAQSEAMRRRVESGNFVRLMAEMSKAARGAAVAMTGVALEAARGADLLLGGLGGLYTGLALAEKLDRPFVQAHVLPFTPTGELPGVLAPPLPFRTGRRFNRLTHHLTRQMVWQGFRSADAAARAMLELPRAPFTGPYGSAAARRGPVLYGFSPHVVPQAADWGADTHVTGYWTLDAADDWSPPPDLEAFLAAGPPPVYVGFGSMGNRDPAQTTALVLTALWSIGQRAVLLSGWGGLRAADLPEGVYLLESAPHEWLFQRMAAIVHHGGAGTTGAALRAGVPSVVVPFFGDQPFWGRRVAALGVGPAPIPRKQLTAVRLAGAIRVAVSDEGMRRRAAALGAKLRAEDGVARAVTVIGGGR